MKLRNSAVTAIFAFAVVGAALLITQGVPGRPVSIDRTKLLRLVMERVERGYIDSVGTGSLYAYAMQGMLRELGDPHASYISSGRVSAMLRERSRPSLAGTGLDVASRDEGIVVVAPYAGSPAHLAGVRPMDRIVRIDGHTTLGASAEEVRTALQGPPGTEVTIAVERAGERQAISFTLLREALPFEPVRASMMLTGDVGYVRLDRFSHETAAALSTAVDSLVRLRMASLVVDLRGNPGGLPEEGIALADLFLPAGSTLATTKGRKPGDSQGFVDSSASKWEKLELILLVDEGTANASEVAAGALQDLDRALVVGRQTFGRGSRQEFIRLSDGAAITLTTARWFTPLGRQIDARSLPLVRSRSDTAARTRPEVRTPSGRRVVGGGGIRPDLVVARPQAPAVNGERVTALRQINTRNLVERDPLVKIAVSLANQAQGQTELFSLAVSLDRADPDDGTH